LPNLDGAGIGHHRRQPLLEGGRARGPIAALADAGEHQLVRIDISAGEEVVDNGGDDGFHSAMNGT
jgi:hypothetical protein